MRRTLTIAALAWLAGCATVSDVTPMGDGIYMVSSHGMSGHGSGPEQKAIAIQKASEYCAAHSRSVEVVKAETVDPQWARPPSAEVDFRCVP